MKKIKIISIFVILVFVLSMASNVKATELKTKLEIVQKAAETKYLDNNQGYISKTIVDSNADTGEIKVQLKIANEKNHQDETMERYDETEIYIMVSEKLSSDEEKLTKYISNIETLAKNIFSKNSKTKIGIVGIKGTINETEKTEDGKYLPTSNDQGSVNGTADNAEIVVNLTNNIETIKSGLQGMNSSKTNYNSNLQAAVRLAKNNYSNKVNKILISLYDDVPGIAIGVCSQISFGGVFSEYRTGEEAVIGKHKKIVSYTKSEILKLKNSNVQFILLRPDDTSYDETWYNTNTGEKEFEFDGSPYVKELYGTLESPTYGKMYSLNNESLEKIVTEEIYSDVIKEVGATMESVVVKDYFPKDIIDNFTITVSDGNTSNVYTTTLQTDGYITWNIGNIEPNNNKVLEYTLKIKDMKNQDLLNKTISTNEKVEVSYKDYLEKDVVVTLSSSPKIQLSEVKEKLIATVTYNPTETTEGNVTATINTNKKVKAVSGWTMSSDGMTLAKVYSTNTTETVHLEDEDGMTKDVVITIANIKSNVKDNTTASGKIPQAGENIILIISILIILAIGGICLVKYKSYGKLK